MLVTALCVLQYVRNMSLTPRVASEGSKARGPQKSDIASSATEQIENQMNGIMGASMSSQPDSHGTSEQDEELLSLAADVYDIIKDIRDPEKPNTLEELNVVFEDGIQMSRIPDSEDAYTVHIAFTPTVPHCSLATLIGLCIRIKLERSLPYKHKVDIYITKGTHSTEDSINKQINDKERIAAAMENPNLKELVERCIKEDDY